MFSGPFKMHERCEACGFKYEREPGYFLGSIYVNYGLTALLLIFAWVTLRFGVGVESKWLLAGLLVFCIAFQTFFFRYARALWLAMDCRLDSSIFADTPQEAADARR